MSTNKDATPLTAEETLEALAKVIRNPRTKASSLLKAQAAHSKLLKKQPKASTPPEPLWKPEDFFPVDGSWPNSEPIEALKAANEIIKAPGFWTLVDGERWGPEMRKQGRRFGSITASGQDTGIWEETGIVLEEVMNKMGSTKALPTPAVVRRVQPVATEIPRHLSEFAVEDVELHPLAKKAMEDRQRKERERIENPEIIV